MALGASFYWPSTCELEGMTPYSQVVYEYRLVLTIWLEANTLYGPEHPETLARGGAPARVEGRVGRTPARARGIVNRFAIQSPCPEERSRLD